MTFFSEAHVLLGPTDTCAQFVATRRIQISGGSIALGPEAMGGLHSFTRP